ncbi:putative inactive ATP-dependent zinc metalloprotease FTSHI 2, chloroplastic [Drosera capensis]
MPFTCTAPHPFAFPSLKPPPKPSFSCRCTSSNPNPNDEKPQQPPNKWKTLDWSEIVNLSVTMTVISTSIPRPASATATKSKTTTTGSEEGMMTPEEVRNWSAGLPSVTGRVGYSELLTFKEEGRLKHVVRQPTDDRVWRREAELILAVMDDDYRVLRTVVPSVDEDPWFWIRWDELGIEGICMDAYTPPVREIDVNEDVEWFFGAVEMVWKRVLDWANAVGKKIEAAVESRKIVVPVVVEEDPVRREREELARKKAIEAQERKIAEMKRREEEDARKVEETKRKEELKKERYEATVANTKQAIQSMNAFFNTFISAEMTVNLLAVVFFIIFYQVVVISYQKKKKDMEDRRKIEQFERDEKRMDEDMDAEEEGDDKDNQQMKMAQKFMSSGARRLKKRLSQRQPEYMEKNVDVKFSDVAGLGKIRLELEEVVKFFTHADMYRRRGIRIPGGILLCGPPGVGKTLLAKAVAGEAGVNFFYVSASQFVEIYVGVGASRVRQLYEEARENAPSIVFIDELDAVGRKRGLVKGSGGQERDATLNQLLVCLDGFEGRGEVITIASTNREDILDEALIRPGRFDRKINIPLPSLIGRIEILKVHARKKKMAADVDYEVVASVTSGMSGAELANLLEVAGSRIMRAGRTEVTTDDLLEAVELEQFGMLDNVKWNPEMWRRIALHQAASVVVAVNFPSQETIEFVTISPRSVSALGHIRRKVLNEVEVDAGLQSRQSLLNSITVLLAPRAADEMWHGESQLGTMWAETTHKAREAAREFVLGGLAEKNHGLTMLWTDESINDIDFETMRILNLCYERTKEILHRNKKLVDVLADELVGKKRLVKKEILEFVRIYGSLEPVPPSILDIRMQKLNQLQLESGNQPDSGVMSNEVKAFQLLLSNLEDGSIECNDSQPVPDIKTKDRRLMKKEPCLIMRTLQAREPFSFMSSHGTVRGRFDLVGGT